MIITKEKKKELQNELKRLIEEVRPSILSALNAAREMGDLSENDEYHEVRKRQRDNEEKILEIEEVLQNAEVVEKKVVSDNVRLGDVVTLKINDKEMTYSIGLESEKHMHISEDSPIAQGVIGKKKGEKVEVESPSGKIKVEILSIT